MLSTTDILKQEIGGWERGRIFFIDDFPTYESQWGVRFGLSTLAQEGFIVRLARGIYCYPRIVGEFGPRMVLPEPETIAYALAARERVRIIPYGDQAAYEIGLTSLRVSDLKYLTDGAPRTINLAAGRKIYFNHTSEVKMFDFCNRDMLRICSAIRALGADMIGDEQRRKIREVLRNVTEKDYRKDIGIPPAWVKEIIADIWEN